MSVRVGLVGTSGWAEFIYLQNLQGFHHGDIVALAARNEARLEELGKQYGITHLLWLMRRSIQVGLTNA
jgi:predicted dehydrogenase